MELSQVKPEIRTVLITECMLPNQPRAVRLRYLKDGVEVERLVHPYSVKDGRLWGFDPKDGEIKQFKLEKIVSATADEPFTPRAGYRVEIPI